jgi:hypothetical protein
MTDSTWLMLAIDKLRADSKGAARHGDLQIREFFRNRPGGQELTAGADGGRMGLTLAARSCSLLKVAPQVLHRHPVIGVFAAFAAPIRDGLKDRPISLPHCRHKCLDTQPLFSVHGGKSYGAPHPRQKASKTGRPVTVYRSCTLSACKPFGPLTTSNCTAWPSWRLLKPLD